MKASCFLLVTEAQILPILSRYSREILIHLKVSENVSTSPYTSSQVPQNLSMDPKLRVEAVG